MTDFLTLLQHRRSIRKYQDRPVEQEKIDKILQAALMSPAGKRLNPWEFVVVQNHDTLCRMASCRTYGSQLLENSPLGIVVCANTEISDTWQFDCAITAMNMMLETADLGLGSCWVQIYNRKTEDNISAEQTIKQLLSLPEHLTPVCVVSIGYINEERRPYDFQKLPYDKIHREKY